MTERSLGAPDPVGDPPGGEGAQQSVGAFWNLAEIRRSDDLMEALATRGPLPEAGPADGEDPAARLLRALIADVDAGAPELPNRRADAEPSPAAGEGPDSGGGRRGPRTIVALGLVGPLLTGLLTTGVAAAAGGFIHRPGSTADAGERPARPGHAEVRTDRDRVMPAPWRRTVPTSPAAAPTESPTARLRRHGAAPQDPPPSGRVRTPAAMDRPAPEPEEQTPTPGTETTQPEESPAPTPSHDGGGGGRVPSPTQPVDAPLSDAPSAETPPAASP
ncbi:hypothetical protein [Thermomonospora catenispora]|uniref:hypothetical protein n=1 Tax=Thermomonospora catenispora TaxID=2493090 RepID=UPI0011226244|nr:hypothetical protein [Thermomonospora catenispora]TNY38752.1 hypothetical protein EIO00_00720 [Thermomonospora catenispora]